MATGSNRKPVRQYPALLLVLAVLITAGCIEPDTPAMNATTAQTLGTSAVPTQNPGQTPGPVPEQVAYVSDIQCAVGDRTETTYHCNGNVRIRGMAYGEVQVIARYPDNNTFTSGSVPLGGTEPLSKPFAVFPDIRYQGQDPDYFVRLDNTRYPVVMSGTSGTAWSNLPGQDPRSITPALHSIATVPLP